MTTQAQKIAWDIINCGLCNAPNTNSVCNPLYRSQSCSTLQDFQIPEPWNGDIINAPILFVGLNPGFTKDELYPKVGNTYWSQSNGAIDIAKVEDFFENRFNGFYVKHSNGRRFRIMTTSLQEKIIRGRTFWGYIKSVADKILNTSNSNPGVDFAITEIVHCKSKNIACIPAKCYEECLNKHFDNILSIAQNLKFIVIIGQPARERISKHLGIASPDKYQWYNIKIYNRSIQIIFVDHNAGGGSAKRVPTLP